MLRLAGIVPEIKLTQVTVLVSLLRRNRDSSPNHLLHLVLNLLRNAEFSSTVSRP